MKLFREITLVANSIFIYLKLFTISVFSFLRKFAVVVLFTYILKLTLASQLFQSLIVFRVIEFNPYFVVLTIGTFSIPNPVFMTVCASRSLKFQGLYLNQNLRSISKVRVKECKMQGSKQLCLK